VLRFPAGQTGADGVRLKVPHMGWNEVHQARAHPLWKGIPDASRFYKSGKSFLYRYLPFQLASLLNRVVVVFVPMLLILIPSVRSIPKVYRWQMRLRIIRWYRALMVLENSIAAGTVQADQKEEIERQLANIEHAVNKMKVPASFADQFYGLRVNIDFVRTKLTQVAPTIGK